MEELERKPKRRKVFYNSDGVVVGLGRCAKAKTTHFQYLDELSEEEQQSILSVFIPQSQRAIATTGSYRRTQGHGHCGSDARQGMGNRTLPTSYYR